MTKHIVVIGTLFTLISAAGFVLAAMAFISVIWPDVGAGGSGSIFVDFLKGMGILLYLTFIVLPGFFAGFGLLLGYEWADSLAIMLGALSLVFFPLGTIFGIYVIWGLSHRQSDRIIAARSAM